MKEKEILDKLAIRAKFVKEKKFKEADAIKTSLRALGIEIYDVKGPTGLKTTGWKCGKHGSLHVFHWPKD